MSFFRIFVSQSKFRLNTCVTIRDQDEVKKAPQTPTKHWKKMLAIFNKTQFIQKTDNSWKYNIDGRDSHDAEVHMFVAK